MRDPRSAPAGVPADSLDRATVPLLNLITRESLDEDYQHAAERRARADGEPPRSRRPRLVAMAVLAVFGLLVAVAAVQTSEQAGITSAGRATLIAQITDQRETVAELQEQIVRLRTTNLKLEETLAGVDSRAATQGARAERLRLSAGFARVSGPGVVITVDDAPSGAAVRAEDLAALVNGLWSAGAEAVAINGKRLTGRSYLSNSGAAINLNGPPPMSPPYVVSAIGDSRTLQADLLESGGGLTFRTIAESLGFPYTMDNVDRVTLPPGPLRHLRLRWAVAGSAADQSQSRKEMDP